MPNIHTWPLTFFVLFDVVYIIACVFLYVYLFKYRRKKTKSKQSHQNVNFIILGIVALTLFSMFLMTKWIVFQMVNGCTQTFFWNSHCYNLNHLCRPWLIICGLIGVNAIVLSVVLDLQAQAKRVHQRKK